MLIVKKKATSIFCALVRNSVSRSFYKCSVTYRGISGRSSVIDTAGEICYNWYIMQSNKDK